MQSTQKGQGQDDGDGGSLDRNGRRQALTPPTPTLMYESYILSTRFDAYHTAQMLLRWRTWEVCVVIL